MFHKIYEKVTILAWHLGFQNFGLLPAWRRQADKNADEAPSISLAEYIKRNEAQSCN
jgi:hypothetical protein